MHKVIESNLKQFSKRHSVEHLEEQDRFERFCNFCVISKYFHEDYDVESVTTSSDDFGLDGVAVLLDDVLFTTGEDAKSYFDNAIARRRRIKAKYVFVQAKRSESFDLGEVLKAGNGLYSLLSSDKVPNDERLAGFLSLHAIVLENFGQISEGRPDCELYYACTGLWNAPAEIEDRGFRTSELQLSKLSIFKSVSYQPLDRENLINLWIKSGSPISTSFPIRGAVPLPNIKGVTEAYLTLVQGIEFVRQVLSDKEGRLRTSVFDQNVRAFLGDDNPVNSRMREALSAVLLHDRFAMNNNGITLISPDVTLQNDRISVSDYQIVNGCQTSHVLYRNQDKLTPDVWVSVKVIEAEDLSVVEQVVQATNSQSTVLDSQLFSIASFTQRVEQYFNSFEGGTDEAAKKLYFERRTNQYADQTDIKRIRVFDIAKLARAYASMFLDIPHIAYMYPTQVLKQRAKNLFQEGQREHAYYTAALAMYRLELSFGNTYVESKYQPYKWHMLTLVKYLALGDTSPMNESPKLDKSCKVIEALLVKGGTAAAQVFVEAAQIIDEVGLVTPDKRKGKPYTDSLVKLAIKKWKAKQKRKS